MFINRFSGLREMNFTQLFVIMSCLLIVGCAGQNVATTATSEDAVLSGTAPETVASADSITADSSTFASADVSTHNSAASCWTIVNGDVYDVTEYVPLHPGGAEQALKLCGKDGTAAFEQKHGGQPKPEATLEKYLIGTLA